MKSRVALLHFKAIPNMKRFILSSLNKQINDQDCISIDDIDRVATHNQRLFKCRTLICRHDKYDYDTVL